MSNRLGIPEIDFETQIAKGVDKDLQDFYAVEAVAVAVQYEPDPNLPEDQLITELNRHAKEKYPDGPTPELLGAGSWYELNINAHQARREAIFRGLGVTTLDLLESAGSPYSIDYLRNPTVNEAGQPRVRTAWGGGLEIPQQYLDMFDLKPPPEDEVASREADAICFYDNGEYFFPTFQFVPGEGDPQAAHIEVVERLLGIQGKYPSIRAALYWMERVPKTKFALHEFTLEENFDPKRLWNIYLPHSTRR